MMFPRVLAALAAVLACLSRVHVTVSMGAASLSMTGLAWFFSGVAVAVVVVLVVVIRKAVADGPGVVPRGRIA
jgi:hypothetical protein